MTKDRQCLAGANREQAIRQDDSGNMRPWRKVCGCPHEPLSCIAGHDR